MPPITTIGRWPACCSRAKRHDRHEMADMQAVGGSVEAGISGHDAGLKGAVDALEVGHLADLAALD
ncbi:hypothetical protein LPJGGPFB_02521 [Ensifer adhaerens]|uniref:hypothetical protein n=1 Tax=Ensifer adhaerens TaxID=106592 RepID=UPI001569AFF8|nr:hypothetical protein [Ensifer adhaerens]NRP19267.1 hypothetical protein [Ensifer adhaerens]